MTFAAVMSLIRPAFVVIGLIVAVIGSGTIARARRRRRTWRAAAGTVVASRLDGDGHVRFQVAFDHAGREVRFWNRYTSASGVDPVGRRVELLVNPDDPSEAVVTRGGPPAEVVGAVFVAVGVAAAMSGLLVRV